MSSILQVQQENQVLLKSALVTLNNMWRQCHPTKAWLYETYTAVKASINTVMYLYMKLYHRHGIEMLNRGSLVY